jgi:sortase A
MTRMRGKHVGEPDGQAEVTGRPRRDTFGFVLRGIGQTLITLGLVVLLFAVYEVWVTNIFAHRRQAKVTHQVEQEWAQGTDPLLQLPSGKLKAHTGDGIAQLYLPRLGSDYAWTIVEGSTVPTDGELERGPAHYGNTQLPGEDGNFAVAGHRVGKGEPFLNLDKLKAGDAVIVETAKTWYVYCVIGAPSSSPCDPKAAGAALSKTDVNGVPGREIVSPSDGGVVLPVPSEQSAPKPYTTAYLTLTTCTPKFSASQRMIVHAVLDPAYPEGIAKLAKGSGYSHAIPAQITALYQRIGAL